MKREPYAEITSAAEQVARSCRELSKAVNKLEIGSGRDKRLDDALAEIGLSGLREIESALAKLTPALEKKKREWDRLRRYKQKVLRKAFKKPLSKLVLQSIQLMEEIRDQTLDPEDDINERVGFDEMRQEIEALPPLGRKHLKIS